MSITRRLFFGRAAGAVAAAPLIGTHLASQSAAQSAATITGMTAAQLEPNCVSMSSDPMRAAARAALDAVSREINEREKRNGRRQMHRVGSLEIDVAVRRSWSPAFKAHVQVARDDARAAEPQPLLERLRDLERQVYGS